MSRADSPSTHRNREPILAELRRVLPETGRLLEVAAGTGQHASYFGAAFPGIHWFPTDPDATSRASIDAWRAHTGVSNVQPADALDVHGRWPQGPFDAVLNINMIHISPWSATDALMRGASQVLAPGGALLMYGPYRVDGEHTSQSNVDFEAWLKSKDARFGVRDLGEVIAVARSYGLEHEQTVAMPANNLFVIYRKPAL